MSIKFTDEHRSRALEVMLHKAELDVGLNNGKAYPLRLRAYCILEKARHTAIQIRFYRLAWFLWKTPTQLGNGELNATELTGS